MTSPFLPCDRLCALQMQEQQYALELRYHINLLSWFVRLTALRTALSVSHSVETGSLASNLELARQHI